jgi:ribosomal protein S18 acetylase RimI-like enzyme
VTREEPVPSSTSPIAPAGQGHAVADEVGYREATAADAEGIAELHADSWRRNYRGAYLDSFLDGDVLGDRMGVWRERLSQPGSGQCTVVAERDRAVVGFAHTILDDDPQWGALLDNLHVVHHLNGGGIGSRLMSETARRVIERRPGSCLYLWVLEQNAAAQAFYEARNGTRAGRRLGGPFPGGGRAFTFRYAWPNPATLVTSQAPWAPNETSTVGRKAVS